MGNNCSLCCCKCIDLFSWKLRIYSDQTPSEGTKIAFGRRKGPQGYIMKSNCAVYAAPSTSLSMLPLVGHALCNKLLLRYSP